MTANGQTSEQPTDERDVENLRLPAVKAAYRISQLYDGTGPDGALLVYCWIVDGRLKLIVGGRPEDLGTFEGEAAQPG